MVEDGIDPARAATAAIDHGVAALLWRALELGGCTGALEDFGQSLRAEAELLRFQAAQFLPRAVARAIEPLVEAGLVGTLKLAGVKRHVDIVSELDEGVRAVAMSGPAGD